MLCFIYFFMNVLGLVRLLCLPTTKQSNEHVSEIQKQLVFLDHRDIVVDIPKFHDFKITDHQFHMSHRTLRVTPLLNNVSLTMLIENAN